MILKILLVTMVIEASYAWPITPLEGYRKTRSQSLSLKCGDDKTFQEMTDTVLDVSFHNTGPIPKNCYIKLRVSVKDIGFEDYGIRVTGDIDLRSPSNKAFLSLADEDDTDDEMGQMKKYSGAQHEIAFTTHEDILVVELVIGETGASGKGFNLTVKPHYLCGGKITTNTYITTPDYPQPYPRDFNCLWQVQGGQNKAISITCHEFDLLRRKKNNICIDVLNIVGKGLYCGRELQNKALTFTSLNVILDFRSNENYNVRKGFNCSINIQSQRKDLLLAKFFQ